MIHPETELLTINKDKGRGIFATSFIPKGTLTYVEDPLEIVIPPDDPRLDDPRMKATIETYSYLNKDGDHIISWDNAKYVNHCCQCNTMSTGYGFEIAIRDIHAGDEITDEYGLFNFDEPLVLSCEKAACRGKVNGNDISRYYKEWDQKIKSALQEFESKPQPLQLFLAQSTLDNLTHYLRTGLGYQSVLDLKFKEVSHPAESQEI